MNEKYGNNKKKLPTKQRPAKVRISMRDCKKPENTREKGGYG